MKYYKEILLIEAILFSAFWATNDYLATLLTWIAVPIFGTILIISLIAEKIEHSKIDHSYFYMMLGLALIPAILFLIMLVVNGENIFKWD